MKKDEEKETVARWFLHFISEDLEKLPEMQFLTMVSQAIYCFDWAYGEMFKALFGSGPPREKIIPPKGIPQKSIEESLKEWDHPLKKCLKDVQPALKEALQSWLEMRDGSGKKVVDDLSLLLGIFDGNFKIGTMAHGGDDLAGTINKAKVSFALALDGIPREAIRACRECGKYFLHLTKKPRFFCNSKCTSKAISRKHREKNPKAYRSKQNKIMRRRYIEERAKRLGVSPDKIKLQVRRRKEA